MSALFTTIGFAPLLPLWLLAILGLGAVALCGWGLLSRSRGAILRLCATGVVLL